MYINIHADVNNQIMGSEAMNTSEHKYTQKVVSSFSYGLWFQWLHYFNTTRVNIIKITYDSCKHTIDVNLRCTTPNKQSIVCLWLYIGLIYVEK